MLVDSFISNPAFSAKVALVRCALHSICEQWKGPYEDQWTVQPEQYVSEDNHELSEKP